MIKLNELLYSLNEKTKYTSIDGKFAHKHKYKIDRAGSGSTTITIGGGLEHQHQISNFTIGAAGDDGHAHKIGEKDNGPEEIN